MTQKQVALSVLVVAMVTILTGGSALLFPKSGNMLLAFTLLSLGMQTIYYAYTFMLKQYKKRGVATSFAGGFSIRLAFIVVFF